MRRICLLTGILLVLLAHQLEAKKSGARQFWSRSSKSGDAVSEETIDIDLESSGQDDPVSPYDDNEGDDDDDDDDGDGGEYDVVASGDKDSDYSVAEESGSGVESDDEDETTQAPEVPTQGTTTSKALTPCQQLRVSSQYAKFKPECTPEGAFQVLQCHPVSRDCWCVDQAGREIAGTLMSDPNRPDCNFGDNLSTCVFQLVQNSQGLLGQYKPKCTLDGEYEKVQCQGSECWCVDKYGNELTGTFTNKPKMPKCDDPEKPVHKPATTEKPVKEFLPNYTTITDTESKDVDNTIYNIGNPDDSITLDSESDEVSVEEKEEKTNEINDSELDSQRGPKMKQSAALLTQPGILAAIIGGAVVGLLCMVLLVMFIVYRMKKKDEGSYALEEQKYQNYSYSKAPDKEFYA